MTESTQLQTTENNNTGVAKMEPPPPISTSPSPSSHNNNNNDQQQHQQNHHSQNPFHNQQQQQHYALKWNDFQTSMLSSFRHLRDEEDFVDVTLACDQRSFTAHKVVLSACSPYFRKLLKANPCEHPIVILRDIRCEDVENLLSFMYNGEVNVSHEQLSDFLKTAHLLQVRGLADVNGSSSKLSSITSTKLSLGSSNINNVNNSNNNNNSNSATPSAVVAALTSSSSSTPAVQELKASPSPSTHHWDLSDDNRTSHLTPPPQKRIKSADLFRAQHGISPERLLIEREFPVNSSGGVGIGSSNSNSGQHPLTRERNRDRDHSRETSRDRDRDRDRSLELRDSLLSQALESGQQMGTNQKHPDLASLHAQSAGEESNSSDTEPSDRGDGQMDGTMDSLNGSLDNQRSHSFPSAFLGLQGIPGLLPGPSGIHGGNDFVSRRSLEMRVRATDPRPCPKCGKIYRSAHTLRTHLEDKHTVCPGYRCVLCGTVAKSRNSLHSHMSRQHRGISTKDLPVLPMPSAFDPELASRLLAKAGVKISAAELRARASPTSGAQRGGSKLDLRSAGDDEDDDPEDLTTGSGYGNNNNDMNRYHESLLSNFGHTNTTITRIRNESMNQKNSNDGKDMMMGTPLTPTSTAAGQSLLDTYLQFITENTFGMGMTQEHAAAALHAAKMAQFNALGHGLDKLPSGILPPHFDLSKLAQNSEVSRLVQNNLHNNSGGCNSLGGNNDLIIEPAMRHHSPSSSGNHLSIPTSNGPMGTDIRRDSSEPMDLGLENNQSGSNNDGGNSDADDNYSEDEGVHNT
ncbi:protein abrupt isoform X2 [Episyrphus balteatus]|uniref:protein abrupt isoform X2 n=1 Tax=Episyrphus balteatus TaxID=286459 RepID=UPI002485E9F3|nr:protein abrupt isoform X2 [Episyrphus balteatus]